MKRANLLSLLENHRDEIKRRFAVKRLGVFGSAARDEMREGGDVDLLVEFEGPATFDNYMGLLGYLESLLHARIDLATGAMLKPRLRSRVEKDMIHVA